MQEFYHMGFDMGVQIASDCRKEVIKSIDGIALSNLAGEKLESLSESARNWASQFESWKTGFYDGFMARAEELRA